MPSIGDNQKTWQEIYDWSNGGDEWSQVWGGEDMQWYGVILPRIQAFVTDPERKHTPRTILEIAPGFGRWTKYLKDLCDRLVVVDLAPKCIDATAPWTSSSAWTHSCTLKQMCSRPISIRWAGYKPGMPSGSFITRTSASMRSAPSRRPNTAGPRQ
jgi:hypothetical protein